MSLVKSAAAAQLAARGLRKETLDLFGIESVPDKEAWRFPIRTITGKVVGEKFKAWSSGQQKYWWGEGERLPIYGLDTLLSTFPDSPVVHIVEGEADLWVAHQAGIPAIAITRGANYVPAGLESLLQSLGVEVVHIIYDNDDAGRHGAKGLLGAFSDITATALTLPEEVGRGGDITDLYKLCKFDDEKFRAAIIALPESPIPESKQWRTEKATTLRAHLDPLPPWLVSGLLRVGELAILSGRHDSYKSWFALELAIAVASGFCFCGYIPCDMKGKVLLVQEEISPLFFRHRVGAVTADLNEGEAENLLVWNRQGLVVQEGHESLSEFLDVVYTEQPLLVIVDNLSCVYPPGFGENDASAMTEFFAPFKEIRDAGSAVVLVHHDRKPGAMEGTDSPRGSSVLENAPDVRIRLLRDPDARDWVEVRSRLRNSEGLPPFWLQFDRDLSRLKWRQR